MLKKIIGAYLKSDGFYEYIDNFEEEIFKEAHKNFTQHIDKWKTLAESTKTDSEEIRKLYLDADCVFGSVYCIGETIYKKGFIDAISAFVGKINQEILAEEIDRVEDVTVAQYAKLKQDIEDFDAGRSVVA